MNENTNIAGTIATTTAINAVGLSTLFVVSNTVKSLLPYAVAATPYTRAAAMIGTTAISVLASDAVMGNTRDLIKLFGRSIDAGKKSRKTEKNN